MTFLQYLVDRFAHLQWMYIAEILLLFITLYFVFSYYKRQNALWFTYIQVICVLVVFAMCLLNFTISKALILLLLIILSVFPAILFTNDIRRSLFRLTWHDIFKEQKGDEQLDIEQLQSTADAIVKACLNMSKNDVGALIVIYENVIESIVESGTYVNAKVSSELIETVFFPKSPLHDGAVIIVGNKIVSASCYLPLTSRQDFPKEFGTRHRAAIGVTEQYPQATAIVVSEESGVISACHDGKMLRYLSGDSLYEVLRHALKLRNDKDQEKAIWGVNYEE
ncbi:MAG: diadenylate cyclase [Clostridia bacterium]|nr:diadenylate cyclase [Clostridia bacterium]